MPGFPAAADAATGWYIWQAPGQSLSIHLRLDVVEALRIAVIEGFKSLPRRGLEIGGLLLGRVRTASSAVVVEIEHFEPLECEHAVGPSYLLSATDRRALEKRIAQLKGGAGKLSIVGFYRSHTRKDFALTVEDVSLMSAYFTRASDVFLLIKPDQGWSPAASFFVWEGGTMRSDASYPRFPFDPAALASGGHQVREAPAPAAEESAAVRAGALAEPRSPVPVAPQQSPAAPGPSRTPRITFRLPQLPVPSVLLLPGIAAVVLLCFLVPRARQSGRPPSPASAAPLALRLDLEGRSLRLHWNGNAPAVKNATRAVLWIDDGEVQEKLQLDAAQLGAGSVVYWPRGSDINFRLEVSGASGYAAESVRAVGVPGAEAASAPAPVERPASDAPLLPVPPGGVNAPPLTRSERAVPIRENKPPRPGPGGDRQPAATRPAPVVVARELPARPKSPPPDPPVEILTSQGFQPPPPLPIPAVDALPRPGPDPFVRVDVEPASGPRVVRTVGQLPLIGRLHKESDIVPPAPLRRSLPDVPVYLRNRVRHEVRIDVRVWVDAAGKVEDVELLSDGTGPNRDLASLAVFSSRRWEFVPAHEGERKVTGKLILRYRFGPEAAAGSAAE